MMSGYYIQAGEGWTCAGCGAFVFWTQTHNCGGINPPQTWTVTSPDDEIVEKLDEILEKLDELLKGLS